MPCAYSTPPHLRRAELWRLCLVTGEVGTATLSPKADSTAVVWYLHERLQDAAEFQDRDAAIKWTEDVGRMLTTAESA